MGRREEEIAEVAAELERLVAEAEASVEALTRILRGEIPAEQEGEPHES